MIFLLFILCNFHEQTNWMGGSGVLGPVTNWGTQYDTDNDSITVANEGQVSLIAIGGDYTNWPKHTIDATSGVWHHTQGLFPADVDGDGIIDVVGHADNQVKWYKHNGNYGFTINVIGAASDGGVPSPCTFPCDLDSDGDIDVLVATGGVGVGWFENLVGDGSSWSSLHSITSGAYHRVSAADIDLDGDMDVIAVDNSDFNYCGTIYIWKNDGFQNFGSPIQSIDAGTNQSWRVYPVDFNDDGYPDLYSVLYNAYVYLNDGTGHFNLGWHDDFWGSADFDGAWPVDIDMNGTMDLVVAGYSGSPNYHFYALLNLDGTGTNFQLKDLGVGGQNYADGAMARDMDLDGLSDIAGDCGKVGWFRQTGSLSFTLYPIDDLSGLNYSHWIYAAPLCDKCVPTVDLLVTEWGVGHKVYENNMLSAFASYGELISSILELDVNEKRLQWFGWEACVPGNSTIAFSYRADSTVAGIQAKPWSTPHYAINEIDSMEFPPALPCYKYFQYRVELWPNASPLDVAVLYRVWLEDTICVAGIEETPQQERPISLQVREDKILLSIPDALKDAKLSIYNVAGGLIETLYEGTLSANTYTFTSGIQISGIYLVVLKWPGGKKTAKFIKL